MPWIHAKEHADELKHVLDSLKCSVNLILGNPTLSNDFQPSSTETAHAFQKKLITNGIRTMLRVSRGIDIEAGCGQLRSRWLDNRTQSWMRLPCPLTTIWFWRRVWRRSFTILAYVQPPQSWFWVKVDCTRRYGTRWNGTLGSRLRNRCSTPELQGHIQFAFNRQSGFKLFHADPLPRYLCRKKEPKK